MLKISKVNLYSVVYKLFTRPYSNEVNCLFSLFYLTLCHAHPTLTPKHNFLHITHIGSKGFLLLSQAREIKSATKRFSS